MVYGGGLERAYNVRMHKPLHFVGTAHPAAHASRQHVSDLNSAEIQSTDLGVRGRARDQTPVLYEHDGGQVGRVLTSWPGQKGELRVAGTIHDPEVAAAIRSRRALGLSLGTHVVHDAKTTDKAYVRKVEELSVCEMPRRPHCWIDEVDGQRVRMTSCKASARAGTRSALASAAAIVPALVPVLVPAPALASALVSANGGAAICVGAAPRLYSTKSTAMNSATDAPNGSSAMSAAPPVADDDTPSKELVEMLKKQLAEANSDRATLRVKAEQVDQQKRDFLSENSESMQSYLKELHDNATPHDKSYLDAMCRWGDGVLKTPSEKLEENMSIAVLVANASANSKRSRESEEAAVEKENALRQAMSDKEAAVAEKDKYQKLYTEMKALAEERQGSAEELASRLARVTGTAHKYAYSHSAASRERTAAAPEPLSTTTNTASAATNGKAPVVNNSATPDAAGLVTMQDNASGGLQTQEHVSPIDALSSFIGSNGSGGSRYYHNKAHDLVLGNSEGSSSSSRSNAAAESANIAAVVRAANGPF